MTGEASSPIVSIEIASSRRGVPEGRSALLPQNAQKSPPSAVRGALQLVHDDMMTHSILGRDGTRQVSSLAGSQDAARDAGKGLQFPAASGSAGNFERSNAASSLPGLPGGSAPTRCL